MKTRNISLEQLHEALSEVNKLFDSNITMTVSEVYTSSGQPRHNVKLGIVDSSLPGAKFNPRTNRRIAACCWHVFGHFIDALGMITENNPEARVVLNWHDDLPGIIHPSEYTNNWVDWNVGSTWNPIRASQCCYCEPY